MYVRKPTPANLCQIGTGWRTILEHGKADSSKQLLTAGPSGATGEEFPLLLGCSNERKLVRLHGHGHGGVASGFSVATTIHQHQHGILKRCPSTLHHSCLRAWAPNVTTEKVATVKRSSAQNRTTSPQEAASTLHCISPGAQIEGGDRGADVCCCSGPRSWMRGPPPLEIDR